MIDLGKHSRMIIKQKSKGANRFQYIFTLLGVFWCNTLFPKVKLTNNEIIYLYDIMRFDKKNYKDNTNFVLLKDVGSCVTDQTVIKESIDAGINYYLNN